MKLALAQISPQLGAVQHNLQKHLDAIQKAKKERADIIVFPELSLCGYYAKDMYYEILPEINKAVEVLREESHGITIILGLVEENKKIRGVLHNSALMLKDGVVLGTAQKVYLPDYGMFEDMKYFKPGNKLKVFETDACRIGIAICEDFWHPEVVYTLALKGADIVVLMSASPFMSRKTGEMLNRIRAIENTVFIAYVNNAGAQEGIVFWGGSEVITPTGTQLIKARYIDEDLVYCDIDLDEVPKARAGMPVLRDARKAMLEELVKAHGELNED